MITTKINITNFWGKLQISKIFRKKPRNQPIMNFEPLKFQIPTALGFIT